MHWHWKEHINIFASKTSDNRATKKKNKKCIAMNNKDFYNNARNMFLIWSKTCSLSFKPGIKIITCSLVKSGIKIKRMKIWIYV